MGMLKKGFCGGGGRPERGVGEGPGGNKENN